MFQGTKHRLVRDLNITTARIYQGYGANFAGQMPWFFIGLGVLQIVVAQFNRLID